MNNVCSYCNKEIKPQKNHISELKEPGFCFFQGSLSICQNCNEKSNLGCIFFNKTNICLDCKNAIEKIIELSKKNESVIFILKKIFKTYYEG